MAIINKTTKGNVAGTTVSDDLIIITNPANLAATNLINGDLGTDEIRVSGAGNYVFGAGVTNIESIVIGTGVDTTAVSTATTATNVNTSAVTSAISITGNAGNNILIGTAFADTINGGGGKDTITGGLGKDSLLGGDGDDTFIIAKAGEAAITETINGGAGSADTIRFTSNQANDTLLLNGNTSGIEKVVIAGATATSTTALNLNASLVNSGLNITGSAGANRITGTTSADTVVGGAGNDTVVSGLGDDSLDGGAGSDTYIFNNEYEFSDDIINDKGTTGVDTVVLNSQGEYTLSAATKGIEVVQLGLVATSTFHSYVDATAVTKGLTVLGNDSGSYIKTTAFADKIFGGGGSDNMFGGAGNDSIDGGADNDYIHGEAGADTLKGGLGNDTIFGDALDSIDGGANNPIDDDEVGDILVLEGSYTQANNARLTGIEQIRFQNELDGQKLILTGQTEAFFISHDGDYSASIVGGSGNDTIFAYSDDTISGGAGIDTLVINPGGFSSSVDKNLQNIEAITFVAGGSLDLRDQTEGFLITGSDVGKYGGSDYIIGGAGADTIFAGSGNDYILINKFSDVANDLIDGGSDFDYITVNVSEEDIDGTLQLINVSHVEKIYIDGDYNANLDVSLINGDGYGGGYGGYGGGFGSNFGGGYGGLDIVGNGGDNYISATNGSDEVHGNSGNDILVGNAGRDLITGDDGDDTIDGGEDNDLLAGNEGNDIINAGTDDDQINGGTGDDTIDGGADYDLVNYEGNYDDFIIINTDGVLTIIDKYGSEGTDVVTNVEAFNFNGSTKNIEEILSNALPTLSVEDPDDDNSINGTYGSEFIDGGAGNDTIYANAGKDYINGGTGNDTIYGGDGADLVNGGAGNDSIDTSYGTDILDNDTLNGGDGNDTLNGGVSDDAVDYLAGGTGDDTYYIGYSSNAASGDQVEENESEGTDTVIVDFAGYTLEDNFENLTLLEESAAVTGNGNYLNNVITGNSNNNTLNGEYGSDTLLGAYGSDTLNGGEDADNLDGGVGNDSLTGGAGADTVNVGEDEDNDFVMQGYSDGLVVNYADVDYASYGSGFGLTNGDTFSFSAIDVVNNFNGNNDSLQIGNASYTSSTFTAGLADNTYSLVQGAYDVESNIFTANNEGADTFVLYDADTSGGISLSGVVLTGVLPTDMVENINVT